LLDKKKRKRKRKIENRENGLIVYHIRPRQQKMNKIEIKKNRNEN